MLPDLLIRDARLPDGRAGVDVSVAAGRIVEVAPGLNAQVDRAVPRHDCGGMLLAPPFVDAHFHLDAALSVRLPRLNESGTLLEGIKLWGELKPTLVQEAILERALRYCDWAVARGLLAIRTHVDVCDPRLLAVEALLEVKRRVAPYLDLQLVAFPQDGSCATSPPGRRSGRHRDSALRPADAGARPRRRCRRRHPPLRADEASRGANPSGSCARRRRAAGCGSTCIATRPTTRCRGTSRRSPSRPGAWGSGPGHRLAPDVDALDGQLLRVQADPADGRGGRRRDRQSADQHHASRAGTTRIRSGAA